MGPEMPTFKCLSEIDDNSLLWHKRLGHASFTTMKKLISKDLVRGLPNERFSENQICGACAQGKHVRSTFKQKGIVSTKKPLELLDMELYGSI